MSGNESASVKAWVAVVVGILGLLTGLIAAASLIGQAVLNYAAVVDNPSHGGRVGTGFTVLWRALTGDKAPLAACQPAKCPECSVSAITQEEPPKQEPRPVEPPPETGMQCGASKWFSVKSVDVTLATPGQLWYVARVKLGVKDTDVAFFGDGSGDVQPKVFTDVGTFTGRHGSLTLARTSDLLTREKIAKAAVLTKSDDLEVEASFNHRNGISTQPARQLSSMTIPVLVLHGEQGSETLTKASINCTKIPVKPL